MRPGSLRFVVVAAMLVTVVGSCISPDVQIAQQQAIQSGNPRIAAQRTRYHRAKRGMLQSEFDTDATGLSAQRRPRLQSRVVSPEERLARSLHRTTRPLTSGSQPSLIARQSPEAAEPATPPQPNSRIAFQDRQGGAPPAADVSTERLLAIGRLFEQQGRADNAAEIYQSILNRDPGQSEAQSRLRYLAGQHTRPDRTGETAQIAQASPRTRSEPVREPRPKPVQIAESTRRVVQTTSRSMSEPKPKVMSPYTQMSTRTLTRTEDTSAVPVNNPATYVYRKARDDDSTSQADNSRTTPASEPPHAPLARHEPPEQSHTIQVTAQTAPTDAGPNQDVEVAEFSTKPQPVKKDVPVSRAMPMRKSDDRDRPEWIPWIGGRGELQSASAEDSASQSTESPKKLTEVPWRPTPIDDTAAEPIESPAAPSSESLIDHNSTDEPLPTQSSGPIGQHVTEPLPASPALLPAHETASRPVTDALSEPQRHKPPAVQPGSVSSALFVSTWQAQKPANQASQVVVPPASFPIRTVSHWEDVRDPKLVSKGQPAVRAAEATSSMPRRSLVDCCPEATGRVLELVRRMDGGIAADRKQAANELARLGSEAVSASPALLKLLEDDDPSLRVHVARAILNIDARCEAAADALIGLLHNRDPDVRQLAAYALGSLDRAPSDAEPVLTLVFDESVGLVRVHVANALVKLHSANGESVESLIDSLRYGGDDERWLSAFALEDVDARDASRVVKELSTALGDRDARVRAAAALVLGGFGTRATLAIPSLVEAAGEDNEFVREAADISLACIKSSRGNDVPAQWVSESSGARGHRISSVSDRWGRR